MVTSRGITFSCSTVKENENILVQENIVYFSDDLTNKDRNKKQYCFEITLSIQTSKCTETHIITEGCHADDKELIAVINDVSDNCEICFKYKKPKPRPKTGFPIAKRFNETIAAMIALDLKKWSSDTWLHHMIDYLTRFSASCVIKSKCKDVIVKKIFQIWIYIFGSPKKFLVDHEGEFNNHKFTSLCENVNIHICTMAAEAPWSNGLVERHNAILGYRVAKTIDNVKCDLELTLAWVTAAKNSLKNINWFSPNQMTI